MFVCVCLHRNSKVLQCKNSGGSLVHSGPAAVAVVVVAVVVVVVVTFIVFVVMAEQVPQVQTLVGLDRH